MIKTLHYMVTGLLVAVSLALFSCASEDSSQNSRKDSGQATEQYADEEQYTMEEPDYLLGEHEHVPASDHPDEAIASGADAGAMGYIPEGQTLEGEPYVTMHAVAGVKPNDRRYICGQSSNVFVGEVMSQTTSVPQAMDVDTFDDTTPKALPQMQFNVALADLGEDSPDPQIKGTLSHSSGTESSRTVYTVNQVGGQIEVTDPVELANGDPLLTPGDIVLLATDYDSDNDWYSIIFQPYADARMPSDSAKRDRMIRDMKTACRYEKTIEDAALEFEEDLEATEEGQYDE